MDKKIIKKLSLNPGCVCSIGLNYFAYQNLSSRDLVSLTEVDGRRSLRSLSYLSKHMFIVELSGDLGCRHAIAEDLNVVHPFVDNITGREVERLAPKDGQGTFKYTLSYSKGMYYFLDCKGRMVGEVNHSCNPNAAVFETFAFSLRVLFLVSLRNINSDEEITIDYGMLYGRNK